MHMGDYNQSFHMMFVIERRLKGQKFSTHQTENYMSNTYEYMPAKL